MSVHKRIIYYDFTQIKNVNLLINEKKNIINHQILTKLKYFFSHDDSKLIIIN